MSLARSKGLRSNRAKNKGAGSKNRIQSRGQKSMPAPIAKLSDSAKTRRDPPAADYSDKVTFEQLARIEQHVGKIDEDDLEVISGPAW